MRTQTETERSRKPTEERASNMARNNQPSY